MKIGIVSSAYLNGDLRSGATRMSSHGWQCSDEQNFVQTENPIFLLPERAFEAHLKEKRAILADYGIKTTQVHGAWRCPAMDFTPENRAERFEAMSKAIGKDDRAVHYKERYGKVRDYFRATYCEDGMLKPEHRTQCAYLLVLRIGLIDEEKKAEAVAALKQKIVDNGYKLSTGFVGTCILNEVLAENGENNLAYSLLLQTENPSWLYSVYQGATTIWERWNSYTKATGFGNVAMNSFNHYAYGAIQEWMYRHMAGIETTEDAPGFAHPILQPKPDTRTPDEIPEGQELIKWVKTSFDSPVGVIKSAWDTTDGFVYECTVPVATPLYLPMLSDADTYTVNGEVKKFSDGKVCYCGKCLEIELQPGSYTFVQK